MNNFNSYFEKLKIKSKEPSLELVKELQKKHLETFSFNNIAVLLGKEISLDIDDVVEKIVRKNLGGYCFEHNLLMYEVLKSLGFSVRILVAKVLNNQTIDSLRTHRITLLEWKGEQYLLDVGFASMTPKIVLNINDDSEKENYRINASSNGIYMLEVLKGNEYFSLYHFDLADYTEADCVMGNFYSSKHPNAVFMNNFVISLKLSDVTLSFRNGVYHRIFRDRTEVIEMESVEQLQLIVNDEFGIPLGLIDCTRLFEFRINKDENMQKTIGILGCGWVGQALKEELENHKVHCLTRDIEENQKLKKYTCDTLVIGIPPRENYLEVLTQTIDKIETSTQVIFLSSTSFYAGKELVVQGETLIKKLHKNVLILRLSGLMGYDRIAGKYTAGKTKTHDALVNYVHRDDVLKIIELCIEKEVEEETFAVTAPLHPKLSKVYAQNAKAFGWEDTDFKSDEVLGRVISSEKLENYLAYRFLKPNPLEFWQ